MGGGGVDDDAVGGLFEAELENDVVVAAVDGHRVAHAAVSQNLLAALTALTPILDNIKGEDRAEFLNRQREVAAHAGELRQKHTGPGRHLDPRLLRDVGGRAPDEGRVRQPLRADQDPPDRVDLRRTT